MQKDTSLPAIMFAGLSGAGKSTQARFLHAHLTDQVDDVDQVESETSSTPVYFEAGARLRALRAEDTLVARRIGEYIDEGQLVPAVVSGTLFFNALKQEFTGQEVVLVDGFPRTRKQAEWAEAVLDFFLLRRVHVIDLEIGRDVARERLLSRGRDDDTPESIARRFAWYDKQTVPVLEFLSELDRYTVHTIDGELPERSVRDAVLEAVE